MQSIRSAIFVSIVMVATCCTSAVAGATPPTCASQGFNSAPNAFAQGYQITTSFDGVQSVIPSAAPSFPLVGFNFSDEAVHLYRLTPTPKETELGWYVGLGNQTGLFVSQPHAYLSYDGTEIDGFNVNGVGGKSTNYWYTMWMVGSVVHFRVDDKLNGSVLWSISETLTSSFQAGGTATGEVWNEPSGVIPLGPSIYSSIQQLNPDGDWVNWSSMHLCADTPYTVQQYAGNSVGNP